MADLEQFLERFKSSSDAEKLWLQHLFVFVKENISPVLSPSRSYSRPVSTTPSVSELSLVLVRILQENSASHTFPVSYRLVRVSELVSLQNVPCVSNLSWTTNQHRAWVREAELTPGLRPLSRVNLLLIGRLSRGRGADLRLSDASGDLTCQSQVQVWDQNLDQAVFLPHWNYIPHNAPGQGLLELIGCPLLLCPGPAQELADVSEGAGLRAALSVSQTAGFLLKQKTRGRGSRGRRVSVRGVVSAVCPLLDVSGTTFFIFSLTNEKTVHIIVKDGSRLWWHRSMHVGQTVHMTELRACTLRGWSGNSVLSPTDQSQLSVQTNQSQLRVETDQSQLSFQTDQSQLSIQTSQSQLGSEESQSGKMDQSGLRCSPVICYRGTVTEVLSRGAGLYLIDGRVALCLANQPLPARPIRPGDRLELSNVHLLLRPSPDFTPIMLCCCLRSSVRVTGFSPGYYGDDREGCPGDGVLARLLLQKNVGVAEYLWMCHVTSRLRLSLFPQGQCLCLLSWKILENISPKPRQVHHRDIYREMMDVPHTCPLSQYQPDPLVPQVLGLSDLRDSLVSFCWSSLDLRSLLPPDGPSLNCTQLNAALSWSQSRLNSDLSDQDQPDHRLGRRPLLLVGLLELPTQTSDSQCLQLRDNTGTISCVVTETGPEKNQARTGPDRDLTKTGPARDQTAAFNTSWIGCLVCVQYFTMVMERFIQSNFPSFKHLDQDQFISSKHCRIYLQFSLDQVHVLSPSVAMTTHLRQGAGTEGEFIKEEEPEEMKSKQRKQDGAKTQDGGRAFVSVVISVEQKEGVAWRNVGAGPTLAFTVRAAVMGPVVSWGLNPKNQPITERETDRDKKVLSLSFCGAACRWFPLLHVGGFYRLVAPDSEDCSALTGCVVAGQSGVELHADSAIQVRADWRIHTVPRPQYVTSESCDLRSLSDIINSRGSDLVSFQALVLDRVGVSDRSQDSSGVRLTVCDLKGRSLQVYLDINHALFIPGLLPGNTLNLNRVQRKVSRSGAVYCSSVAVSCVSVVLLGQSSAPAPPPFPMMLLGRWRQEGGVSVARVRGHVVCVLFLQLQWSCSLCDSVFTESCSGARCRSTSAVFQAKAKVVLEDGSAEAQVWFYSPWVQTLLRLDDSQWEGLQRALRGKGHLQVYPKGQSLSMTCSDPDLDCLLSFFLCLCNESVIGSVSLTCRRQSPPRSPGSQVRRVVRGSRDFVTRVTPPLLLTCVHLEHC